MCLTIEHVCFLARAHTFWYICRVWGDFKDFCGCIVHTSIQLEHFAYASAHFCTFLFFRDNCLHTCASFLSSFVCQHAWMTSHQYVCMCVHACVCVRMGNEQSVMPEREPSLFKLPSGFQASHLQTGTSCSLSLSLSFSHSSTLSLLCMSASVFPPILYVCLYSVLPRLLIALLSLSVCFSLQCQFLSVFRHDAPLLKTTTLLTFLWKPRTFTHTQTLSDHTAYVMLHLEPDLNTAQKNTLHAHLLHPHLVCITIPDWQSCLQIKNHFLFLLKSSTDLLKPVGF